MNREMSPDRRQTIICANPRIFLIGPPETQFNEIFNEVFVKENQFHNTVWQTAATLSRPQLN